MHEDRLQEEWLQEEWLQEEWLQEEWMHEGLVCEELQIHRFAWFSFAGRLKILNLLSILV